MRKYRLAIVLFLSSMIFTSIGLRSLFSPQITPVLMEEPIEDSNQTRNAEASEPFEYKRKPNRRGRTEKANGAARPKPSVTPKLNPTPTFESRITTWGCFGAAVISAICGVICVLQNRRNRLMLS